MMCRRDRLIESAIYRELPHAQTEAHQPLEGMTIEEALKKAMDAGPYPESEAKRVKPKKASRPSSRSSPRTSPRARGLRSQERREPLGVADLPRVVAERVLLTYWFR